MDSLTKWFEKVTAFLFLLMLVGIVAFLTYVPMPADSEKPIMLVIGSLATMAAQSAPKLFGGSDELISKMRKEVSDLTIKYDTLKDNYDTLTRMLVDRHVIDKEGIE